MAISNKKLLEAIETINTFCEEQPCCQSCVLLSFCVNDCNCYMMSYKLSEAMANTEVKECDSNAN